MTRKDFEAFAVMMGREKGLAIRNGDNAGRIVAVAMVAGAASIFGESNPRFDRKKFLDRVDNVAQQVIDA